LTIRITMKKMTKNEIYNKVRKVDGLVGMTVNERLYVTGLMDIYDKAIIEDIKLAKTILEAIKVDRLSIEKIIKGNE